MDIFQCMLTGLWTVVLGFCVIFSRSSYESQRNGLSNDKWFFRVIMIVICLMGVAIHMVIIDERDFPNRYNVTILNEAGEQNFEKVYKVSAGTEPGEVILHMSRFSTLTVKGRITFVSRRDHIGSAIRQVTLSPTFYLQEGNK